SISHMIDCDLFGLTPGAHHLMNVAFHCANAVLLFLLLRQLTGAQWRSAMVAAFFAWHPLHVESVAWISERKDVLSACFGLLCLLAYTAYARKSEDRGQGAEDRNPTSDFRLLTSGYYWLSLVLFALGLLSKPMLVTWPFVLLLLDFWPLKRFGISDFRFQIFQKLVIEKIPFFMLSA